jgi:DNA polymerase-3 subunit delta
MAGTPDAEASVFFLWGEDEYAVGCRAREVFESWTSGDAGVDREIIDAVAGNSDEVQRAVARLREALQTLPFFGGSKSVWFRGCSFLGEDRVSEAQGVLETLAELARELAGFRWDGVRLLITAGKVDRRRVFFKTLDRFAVVEHYPGLSFDDREWRDKAENLAAADFRARGRTIEPEALSAFVEQVGPNGRQLAAEAEKLVAYAGDRPGLTLADVESVTTRSRHARAFALGDAVGERQLARALQRLGEELWSLQSDRNKSEIGLLYGLIGKVRSMLLAKEMLGEGLIRPTSDYRGFAAQLKGLPGDRFPADKRYNPAEINPYVLFRAALHSRNFTREELVAAMEELLRCNRRLVGSGLDGSLVLQMAITAIVGGGAAGAATALPGGRLVAAARRE